MRRLLLILLISPLLQGCMATKTQFKPNGDIHTGHDEQTYLTAEGIGLTEREAKNQARAELSKIFQSRVYGETLDRVSSVIGAKGDEVSSQSAESRVRVITETELKGVEITRTWLQNGNYHATASLDRYKAKEEWMRDILAVDDEIEGILDSIKSMTSRPLIYRGLNSVTNLWIKREVFVSRLRIIGFHETEPSGYSMKSIQRRLSNIRAAMPILVDISGKYGERAGAGISEELGKAGFVIANNRSEATVVMEGNAEVSPVDIDNPDLRYARAVISVKISDPAAGISLGEVAESRRAAHISYPEAEESALAKAIPLVTGRILRMMQEGENNSQ